MSSKAPLLIVEDNPDDFEVFVAALTKDADVANPIVRCSTGDEALDYLRGTGRYAAHPRRSPGLVFLDLNLPGTSGREVLTSIKTSDNLKRVPVIVMTSSNDPEDIDACYRDGANSYLVKPVDLNGFFDTISRLRDYWLKIVVLPEAS